MAASTPHTILLKGRGQHEEAPAGGAITPGHLVKFNSSNALVVHATAAGAATPLFACENEINGKTIADAYATGDYVQAEFMYPGCQVYALVAAAAVAIVAGDLLESAGDGTLRKFGSGVVIAFAKEAVDNSGGGAAARIRACIV
jgi:hypothetical protein